MPEHNFEQQARDMANGFEMEPRPEVWQNVRNAILAPQRKRRFVLWWWLLPIGLLGGTLAFYMLNQKDKEAQVVKTNLTPQKAQEKLVLAMPQHKPDKEIKEETKKKAITTFIIPRQSNTTRQPADAKAFKGTTDEGTGSKEKGDKKDTGLHQTGDSLLTIRKESGGKNNTAFSTNANNQEAANDSTLMNYKHTLPFKDTVHAASITQDSTVAKITHSDSAAISTPKKPQKHTILHWGIMAEGGIATRKSSLFTLAGGEKSNDATTSFPSSNGTGSNITGSTGRNGFHYYDYIQHGAAFGLGLALQKKMNRSVDVSADLAYQYQSFKVSTTAYKDSLVLNNAFALVAGSYKATQTFHFASFFTGVNWHFINTRNIQLGINAGVDNLFLISAGQKVNSISSGNFSLNDAVQISDSAFAKNNFYRYQPSLFAGILFTIKKGDRQLQLMPFARSSFRPFDKNITGSNNHLFSGGLRAVYFFK